MGTHITGLFWLMGGNLGHADFSKNTFCVVVAAMGVGVCVCV